MSIKRAHILLPDDLLREIDALVGPRGRSPFLVSVAREAVKHQKLLKFLESGEAAWKDKDHPELVDGSAAWVRQLRSESERKRARRKHPEKSDENTSG